MLHTRALTFLGELDTVSCSTAFQQEKNYECQTIVSSFFRKGHTSKNQLQRPAGKLKWAYRAIYR